MWNFTEKQDRLNIQPLCSIYMRLKRLKTLLNIQDFSAFQLEKVKVSQNQVNGQ